MGSIKKCLFFLVVIGQDPYSFLRFLFLELMPWDNLHYYIWMAKNYTVTDRKKYFSLS